MDPVVCDSCGVHFPVNALTEDDYRALHDQHYYQGFAEELRMLLKVQEYYRRHPEAEGRIKPHFVRLLESDEPEVMERLYTGVPFDQTDLPSEQLPAAWVDVKDDWEVVEYLHHHQFALNPRLEFVSQEVARLKGSVGAVRCPRCQEGRLHVPPEDWDEFTADDAITWYWPEWQSVDSDGTLHVKVSGWQGGSHWNGEKAVSPDKPEYHFWRWFVAQKEYHRLVEESELPSIWEEWFRRTSRSTDRPHE
jgi:hypothetical protein